MNVTLSPSPWLHFDDNNGNPAVGFLVYTYSAGTLIPITTYTDNTATQANSNPIILDFRGECGMWIPPNTAYKYVFTFPNDTNPPSNPIKTVDQIQNFQVTLTQSSIGSTLWPQTPAETNVGVTPSNYGYPPGDIRRYGAVLNGTTIDTGAVAQWASVGGALTWPVPQMALIDATINLASDTTIQFTEGGGLTTATKDIAFMNALDQANINIYGGTFTQTEIGALGQYVIGGVVLNTCTNCVVEDCKFVGMQWSAVLLLGNTVYCTIRGNYIQTALGTLQDAEDIALLSNASGAPAFNIIDGNFCYGNSEHGIGCWNPYAGPSMPSRNTISNNKVGAHTGYGIFVYSGTSSTDSFNFIYGNEIEGITGSFASNPSSGAGIYIVGQAAGGTSVIGNTIRNCCISTGNATLAPAGIGISGTTGTSVPIVVQGNVIEGMTQYHGILATGCLGGMVISGNSVRMPASNTTGDGIRITNSDSVAVVGNSIAQLNTTTFQRCILFFAQGAGMSGNSCVGNTCTGGHFSQIEVGQTGGNICTGITISGNNCVGGDNSCNPILLSTGAVARAMISGNYCTSGTNPALSHTACVAVRYSNNFFLSTGTIDVSFAGVNTGSLYDDSNTSQATDLSISDTGTGMITVQRVGSAVPSTGTYAAGYTRWFLTPAAAAAPGSICTTAGSPGTHKLMAVLAS